MQFTALNARCFVVFPRGVSVEPEQPRGGRMKPRELFVLRAFLTVAPVTPKPTSYRCPASRSRSLRLFETLTSSGIFPVTHSRLPRQWKLIPSSDRYFSIFLKFFFLFVIPGLIFQFLSFLSMYSSRPHASLCLYFIFICIYSPTIIDFYLLVEVLYFPVFTIRVFIIGDFIFSNYCCFFLFIIIGLTFIIFYLFLLWGLGIITSG